MKSILKTIAAVSAVLVVLSGLPRVDAAGTTFPDIEGQPDVADTTEDRTPGRVGKRYYYHT